MGVYPSRDQCTQLRRIFFQIIISGTMSIKNQQMVILRFEGKKLEDLDFWTKSDPYLTLSRPAKHGPGTVQVRRTETVWNNLNPSWKVLYIPVSELCDGDYQMTL